MTEEMVRFVAVNLSNATILNLEAPSMPSDATLLPQSYLRDNQEEDACVQQHWVQSPVI